MKVRLIHWEHGEGEKRANLLRSLHYDVDDEPIDNAELKLLVSKPPDILVIDLTRLPARGRDIGAFVHEHVRDLPIVFVGGKEWTVAGIKQVIPDATFSEWALIEPALSRIEGSGSE